MNEIWTALIGVFGVTVGIILNEVLRRNRRIETYTARVFDKRLEKYEELMALVQTGYAVAGDVMSNPEYTPEQRREQISHAIYTIALFTDENELYIDRDLAAHCTAAFMGAEEIQGIADPEERKQSTQRIHDMYRSAKQMIREDSGISQIDRLFKRVIKPRLASPIVDRIRYLKAHPEEMRKYQKHQEDESSNGRNV